MRNKSKGKLTKSPERERESSRIKKYCPNEKHFTLNNFVMRIQTHQTCFFFFKVACLVKGFDETEQSDETPVL